MMGGATKIVTLDDIESEADRLELARAEGGDPNQTSIVGSDADEVEIVVQADGDRAAPGEVLPEDYQTQQDQTLGSETQDVPIDDPDEKELSSYSVKVRARIQREIALRKDAENRETAERSARVEAQTKLQSTELQHAELTLALLGDKMTEAEMRLAKAIEDGKTEDQIKIQREIAEFTARKQRVEEARDHLKSRPAASVQAPNVLTVKWQSGNRWFDNPEFAPESQMVRAISAQLAARGIAPNSEKHFEEIDKELKRRSPTLAARVSARLGKDAISWGMERQQAERRGPMLGSPQSPGGFGRPAAPKRQIVITKADMEAMRRVRLDPTNKQHVLQYAKEKQAIASRDGR